MIKYKITIEKTTIEFLTHEEAQAFLTENNITAEITEFFDPTVLV